MASICWSSLGLVFLLAYPYDSRLLSPLVLLAAAPYFLAMASDLRRCGYKRTDVLRIYAFNLILLPVNLAGVGKSLQQAITNQKIPFARTPKVKDRTTAPLLFVVLPYAIVAFSLFTLWRDIHASNWGNAAFAAFNATATFYAIVAYIGLRNSLVDIVLNIVQRLYAPVKPRSSRKARRARAAEQAAAPALDWAATLYLGATTERSEGARAITVPAARIDVADLVDIDSDAGTVTVTDRAGDEPAVPPAAAALLDFVRSVNSGTTDGVAGVALRVDEPGRLTVTIDLTESADPA